MAMTPYGQSPLVISILGTTPQERGLETQQFKAKFDEGLKEFTEWFNATHKTEFEAVQTGLSEHLAENTAFAGSASRDLAIAGVQQIRGLGFKPKSLIIKCQVNGSYVVGSTYVPNKYSDGLAGGASNVCKFSLPSGTIYTLIGSAIRIDINDTDRTRGTVTFVDDGFDINWTLAGGGATGTASIIFLAHTH